MVGGRRDSLASRIFIFSSHGFNWMEEERGRDNITKEGVFIRSG